MYANCMQMTTSPISHMALTKIIIDSRRSLKDGTYPIKIRITFQRKQVYYSTPYNLSKEEFAEVIGILISKEKKNNAIKKSRNEIKAITLELQAYENKAANIIKKLPVFTWDLFEKHFLTNRIENDTISNAFDNCIVSLKRNDQIGTAVSYGCAKKSLENFISKTRFTDVTPDFLRRYEKWMLSNGKSVTTISMYLRHLRTVFNTAIYNELIPKEIYPFKREKDKDGKKYEIPTGNNVKKAMSLSDIELIFNCNIKKDSTAAWARDIWVFSYLCNGMNMKDVCLLKYKNIKGNMLAFVRAKTERTKRKVEPIRVAITPDVQRIISTYGNKDTDPENYIFPVLRKGLTAERKRQLVQQTTRLVNNHMKEIAKDLGIENNITTYSARHSFSTILQRSGVSISFISEALGHSNIMTTQSYLAGFEDEAKVEYAKVLTAFKK